MQRLRFFPDFGGADPLWNARGVGLNLDAVAVQPKTKSALRDWCVRWEIAARQNLDAEAFAAGMAGRSAAPVSEETWKAIVDEGRRLCAQLQQELGDEWQVIYEGPR